VKKTYFIAGTDTSVGKTYAACCLLEAAAKQGLSTMGLKPVAAGCEFIDGSLKNEDALLLMDHMTLALPYAQVNPVALKTATSPHIAAHLEQKNVTVSRLVGFCRGALMQRPDFSLIEGAGGWRVPLNKRETMADLARQLEFEVILVVSLKLGCLNHAMLTAEAIKRDGLKLAGWVGNRVSQPSMPYEPENIATLSGALGAPLIGCLNYNQDPSPKLGCNELNIDCLKL